jgi:hypothetical protein
MVSSASAHSYCHQIRVVAPKSEHCPLMRVKTPNAGRQKSHRNGTVRQSQS